MAENDNFRHPLVRDLHWLYTSAPLLRAPLPAATETGLLEPGRNMPAYGDWLQRLEQLSSSRLQALPERSRSPARDYQLFQGVGLLSPRGIE